MIYSDNTYDITNNIATYTRRDFKTVFDTMSNKWYMLNNLDEYEEYGIYGDSFDTYYTGKLVIVNDHEYEWDGTEWDDLGESYTGAISLYRDSSHTGYITFPETTSNVASIEVTFKMNILPNQSSLGKSFFIGSGTIDENDWRIFLTGNVATGGNTFYYDCGNGRFMATGLLNTKKHFRLCGSPMKIYDYDTNTYIYEDLDENIRPTGFPIYFGYFQRESIISPNYGYIYDLVFYSDNEGQNAIAHYIPYIQNNVNGFYDTLNNTFVGPTSGTLGAESGSMRPKDYPEKAAPTISTLWASTIYRNSAHLTTLMRNDAEMTKMDYMSDDILKKGEAPIIDYLCFEAIEAGTVKFEAPNGFSQLLGEPNLEYSFDKNTWTTLHINDTVSLQANDKIYFRGQNPNGFTYGRGADRSEQTFYINCLFSTNRYNISGNIMTLIDKNGTTTTIPNAYCFANLFCTELTTQGSNNGKIVSAINLKLPATTLQYDCYRNLFNGNQIMTTPPKILPAMTLTDYCYANMFLRCSALLESPSLPAQALTTHCYDNLFFGCVALKKIVCYAISGINSTNTGNWVKGVSLTGDFYKDASVSWPRGLYGIPSGWTEHTSL